MELVTSFGPTVLTLLSVLGVSIVSLVGIAAFSVQEDRLRTWLYGLVALAAGALLGDALIHLIPEALSTIGNVWLFGTSLISGALLFLVLEHILRWHHAHHADEDEHEGHERFERGEGHAHLAPMVLVADGVHNVIDGAVIAASFLVSPALGFATTAAVFLHEIPQEVADYALLLHAGYSRTKALLWNFASGLTALFGALIVLVVGTEVELFGAYASAVTAGAFIYLAVVDLLPEVRNQARGKKLVIALGAFCIGFGFMCALLLLES
jgi:zinc and cadmium transporter